jgi:hypothetical protein
LYNNVSAMKRRREAARRLPPLACGCADPWRHHCTRKPTVGLAGALATLRRVWVFADDDDRRMVERIAAVLPELARKSP